MRRVIKIFFLNAIFSWGAFLLFAGTDAIGSAEEYYNQGQELYKKGDYIGANQAFKQAESIIDKADRADSLLNLTVVAAQSPAAPPPAKSLAIQAKEAYLAARFADAINLYRQVLGFAPNDNNVKYNLAMACLNNDDYGSAVELLREIIKNNPQDADACYNLGVIYESYLPDYDQALVYYRQYLRCAPSKVDAGKVKEWIKYIERQIN